MFAHHFKSKATQLNSLFLAISRRLGILQPPVPRWKATSAFSGLNSFLPPRTHKPPGWNSSSDFFLGPTGPPQASPSFGTNFTGALLATVANVDGVGVASAINPHWLYPSTPWDGFLPSDAITSDGNDDCCYRVDLRSNHNTFTVAYLGGFLYKWRFSYFIDIKVPSN